MIRRWSTWSRANVVFFHVPKTAGVSVSRALYGKSLGHFYASNVKVLMPRLFESAFTFGVSRHPVDRLHSAYRFARSGGTDEMGIRNPKKYTNQSFFSFNDFVTRWLVNQKLENLDGVFRPQYLYLCDDNKIIVDRVFEFSNLVEIEEVLSELLDKEINLKHSNISYNNEIEKISGTSMKIIKDLYRLDFEIFNYPL